MWGRVVAIYRPFVVYAVLGHGQDFVDTADEHGVQRGEELTVV